MVPRRPLFSHNVSWTSVHQLQINEAYCAVESDSNSLCALTKTSLIVMIQIHIKQSVIISLFFSDELPVQLTLPRAMREAKNHQQLSSLALLGQGKVLSCKHFLYDVLKVVSILACSCRKILIHQFVFAANPSNSATIKHWIPMSVIQCCVCMHAHFFPLSQKRCQIWFSLNPSKD